MIALTDLCFRYRKDSPPVLSNINLSIRPGEKVLIAGKNGAGKTTLSKIISGLIPAVEHGVLDGQCLYDGKEVAGCSRAEITKKIAIMFQDFEAQLVSSSVKEEMLFYPLNTGAEYPRAEHVVAEIAARFDITELLSRDIHELSGGEKQKIALFSLLTVDPAVLILDEPFTDIEPSSQEAILRLLGGDESTRTVILFEQSLDYCSYFDRVIILDQGAVVYDGSASGWLDRDLLTRSGLDVPGVCKVLPGGPLAGIDAVVEEIRRTRTFDAAAYAAVSRSNEGERPPLLEVRGLRFRYEGQPCDILHDVNLSIGRGDFVVVLGANGSGKTTLTKLMAGILKPGGGEVLFKGAKVKAGDIGYVYQNPDNQIFAETVFDEVAFALRMKKVPGDAIRGRVESILELMGLGARMGHDPFTLPKGDRQKIACASILVAEPEVIILDEPTTGLDFPSLSEMMGIIHGLRQGGKTVLMITHSMEAAASFDGKVLAMQAGAVRFYGPCREFFADDTLVAESRAGRTGVMSLSLKLNGRLILNAPEFLRCWKER